MVTCENQAKTSNTLVTWVLMTLFVTVALKDNSETVRWNFVG